MSEATGVRPSRGPEQPSVSFVVVTWNSAETIQALLDSIQTTVEAAHEVIVVDNASSDSTVTIVSEHPSEPTLIRSPTNLGLAAGNNLGLQAAAGEWYVICNPDVVLAPGCISELVAAAHRHPRAGFVVARLSHPDGSLQPGVGDLPTLRETIIGRRRSLAKGSESGIWWDGWAHDEERQVGHGQEACYLIRPSAVAAVGGQDERYVLDWEGFDWSERMIRAGYEIWFCPTAVATHIGGVSIRQAQLRWIRSSHRGMYTYFADRSPRWSRPGLALLFTARGLARSATLLKSGNAYRRVQLPH